MYQFKRILLNFVSENHSPKYIDFQTMSLNIVVVLGATLSIQLGELFVMKDNISYYIYIELVAIYPSLNKNWNSKMLQSL